MSIRMPKEWSTNEKQRHVKIRDSKKEVYMCLIFYIFQSFLLHTHTTIFNASRRQSGNQNDRKRYQFSRKKKNDDYYLKNDAEVFRKTKKPDGE